MTLSKKDFAGPWYSIEDAAKKTDLLPVDVLYRIEQGHIKPVLHCNEPRRFLCVTVDSFGYITGHAHYYYSGPLRLSDAGIHRLLVAKKPASLSGIAMQPLQQQFIHHWSNTYPYKSAIPNDVLINWQGWKQAVTLLNQLASVPFPKEHESPVMFLKNMLDTLATTTERKQELESLSGKAKPFVFDRDKYALFTPDDLRIPAPALETLKTPVKTALNTFDLNNNQLVMLPVTVDIDSSNDDAPEPEPEASPASLPVSLISQLTDLQEVFARALQANPDAKSKVLWHLIQEDYARDNPRYDVNGVILTMDGIGVEWKSRKSSKNSKSYELAYTSFAPALTRVRNKMKAAKRL
jgi:hypothetical protein